MAEEDISYDKDTNGLHYHTWRNIISRESLLEKEEEQFTGKNPEKIPPVLSDRYQDQNFIQCVQPVQTFWPVTLNGYKTFFNQHGFKKKTTDEIPDGIRGIVRQAVKKGFKAKAVGSGHSFSDVATTSDFLIVTDNIKEILLHAPVESDEGKKIRSYNIQHYPRLDYDLKTQGYKAFIEKIPLEKNSRRFYGDPNENPALVEFEAGIKIETLNDKLWSMGWSLYNMGTYQGQSFIGAAATATHGSGHKLPPLQDMIKSMVLVTDYGITFRIEPTAGITQALETVSSEELRAVIALNRKLCRDGLKLTEPGEEDADETTMTKKYEELVNKNKDHNAITIAREEGVDFLIQDDEWFASALVNIGTFGIVYSVVIEVIPRYYLLETVELTTWKDVRERLKAQNKYLGPEYLDPEVKRLNDNDYSELFERKKFIARFPVNKHIPCPCSEKQEEGKSKEEESGSRSDSGGISAGKPKKKKKEDTCCKDHNDRKASIKPVDDRGNGSLTLDGSRDPGPITGKPARKEEGSTICVKDIRQTTIEIHPHKYNGHHLCRIIRQYKVEDSEFARRWGVKTTGRIAGAKNPTVLKNLNEITEIVSHDENKQAELYKKSVLITAVAILRPVSGDIFEGLNLFLHKEKRTQEVIRKAPIEPDCNQRYLGKNYITQELPLFNGCGVELGFSTKESPVHNILPAYVDAMDRVLEMAQEHWDLGRYMQTSPIALRMVKASNAYLSMQYSEEKEPTCMIELLNQADTVGGKELFYRYQRELFKYRARPHWGLDFSTTTGNNGLLAKMYPKFNEWKKVYDAFNYSGTFNNRFTDRMGL